MYEVLADVITIILSKLNNFDFDFIAFFYSVLRCTIFIYIHT